MGSQGLLLLIGLKISIIMTSLQTLLFQVLKTRLHSIGRNEYQAGGCVDANESYMNVRLKHLTYSYPIK